VLVLVLIVAYLCTIPFSVRSQRWVAAHPEAWEHAPRERRAARREIRRSQPGRRPLGIRRPSGQSMARLRLRKPGR